MKYIKVLMIVFVIGYVCYFLETSVRPFLLRYGRYQLISAKVMQVGADPNLQFERPVCFKMDSANGDIWIYENYYLKDVGYCHNFDYADTQDPILHTWISLIRSCPEESKSRVIEQFTKQYLKMPIQLADSNQQRGVRLDLIPVIDANRKTGTRLDHIEQNTPSSPPITDPLRTRQKWEDDAKVMMRLNQEKDENDTNAP